MDGKDCPPRYEPAGRLIGGDNVSRCNGCKGLIAESDEPTHICIADLLADEIRSLAYPVPVVDNA